MKDYIKQLEEANEQLQNKLTKSENLNEILLNKQYYIIFTHFKVDISEPVYAKLNPLHHLFTNSLDACKYLFKNWKFYMDDFEGKYKPLNCKFTFFSIESFNVNVSDNDKFQPANAFNWAFEEKKEIIPVLKDLKKTISKIL
jgi:hypothetical protein